MKYILFVSLLFATILFGCDKDEDNNEPEANSLKSALMAHTWVEDSFAYPQLGWSTQVTEEPKDMIRFEAKQYYSVALSGATSDSVNYELSDSSKLYFWDIKSQKNDNQYLKIELCTEKALVISAPTTGVIGTFVYYHAR